MEPFCNFVFGLFTSSATSVVSERAFLGELSFEKLPAHTSTCITHMLSREVLFPTHTHDHAVIRQRSQSVRCHTV